MSMDTDHVIEEGQSALELDDEAVMNMSLDELAAHSSEEPVVEESQEGDDDGETESPSEVSEGEEDEGAGDLEGTEEEGEEESEGEQEEEIDDFTSIEEDESPSEEEESEEEKSDEEPEQYKAQLDQLFAPFKANGKEMKVDNIDDARQLMQMGANYNKKMAGLKPNLKLLKMLDNNGLLDENKLSYLIDLDKKNPAAITKLIKDAGIDPLEVNTEENTEYTPETYTVDDREVELDEVLEAISDSPSYADTINVISNKWDDASRQILASNPAVIKVINDQVSNGIFEQITSVIEKERTFGRLTGLSDIEAYKQVGDRLQAEGAFDKPNAPAAEQKVEPPVKKAKSNPKLREKKRAAAPTKAAAPKAKSVAANFDPLSMSDEDFEKQFNGKFL